MYPKPNRPARGGRSSPSPAALQIPPLAHSIPLKLKHFVLIAVAVLGGCGDPLVGGAYKGRPLLMLEGPIDLPEGVAFLAEAACEGAWVECFESTCGFDDEDRCPPCDDRLEACYDQAEPSLSATPFRLGLFWARSNTGAGSVQQFALVAASFPARYRLSLFAPPPVEVLQPASVAGRYALGLLLVYVDADGDATYTPGRDTIVGGADQRAVLYTPNGMQDERFGRLGPGYHRLRLSAECDTGSGQAAEVDDSPMVLTLSLDEALLRDLVLDPDCDGRLDDFDICLDEDTLTHLCAGADHALCDLCLEALDAAQEAAM